MLAPLADTDDLAARNITVPDGVDPAVALESASSAIRDAAGCSITYGESTVVLAVGDLHEFDLPAGPVASVATVLVGGLEVDGWRKVGDTLYMPPRWTDTLPVEVTVTYTHGYLVIPADVVDLACSVAAMAMQAVSGQTYGEILTGSIRLGDYAETYIHPPGTESSSPVAIPDSVAEKLRCRFNTNVAVIGVRR